MFEVETLSVVVQDRVVRIDSGAQIQSAGVVRTSVDIAAAVAADLGRSDWTLGPLEEPQFEEYQSAGAG